MLKENWSLKSSLSYLKEHLKQQSKLYFYFWFSCFVFEIFQFLWYANYTWHLVYEQWHIGECYIIFAIIKQNYFKMYMFGVVREKHTHMISSKSFCFIKEKIYNILRYVIARTCNLHIKETERTQKWSKGIKNWKSNLLYYFKWNLSNKTNLILGFSSL